MEIALNSRAKGIWLSAVSALIIGCFLALSALQFAAAFCSTSVRLLPLAVRLAPEVAEYHALRGWQLLQAHADVNGALQQFRLATTVNPHEASYWVATANIEQILNDMPGQRYALLRALEADPTTPELAWAAANSFLAQGDLAMALREFKVVLSNQPEMADTVLNLCLRATDVPTLLTKVLPSDPAAYLSLLSFLTWRKDGPGAAQVWNALAHLGKPFEPRRALPYVDYLIGQHDVAAARNVWAQMALCCGLADYLATPDNLIVNAEFDFNLLGGGFDWRFQRKENVEVALDPTQFHRGRRSLFLVFDGPGVEDAGIVQYVPVQPETAYEFSAYYKADDMEGAGGPRLSVQDGYSGTEYFSSDDLRNQDAWRQVKGSFKTAPGTQLLVIRIIRVPSGSPIKGHVWIDDFRLQETAMGL